MDTLKKLCGYLINTNTSIALAESCTGGLLSAMLVSYPGISSVYLCGTVAYSNQAKISRLGVKEAIINTYGAVSPECARAMADGAKNTAGSVIALSTTGIAGPGGGSKAKPVGLVYVGISLPQGETAAYKLELKGTREEIMRQAAQKAIELLAEKLGLV